MILHSKLFILFQKNETFLSKKNLECRMSNEKLSLNRLTKVFSKNNMNLRTR